MTTSFSDLKRNSRTELNKLNQKLAEISQPQNNRDDNRIWTCQTDKAGNGFAVIRFLPAPKGEDLPFARLFTHGFKGPGGWYIENSLTTIGKQDAIAELNSKLWNSGLESDKEIARKQKRKLNYYSNIYVVKDPANPENEGKVFLFRYGKKIFDKINEMMNPPEDPIDPKNPVNPFDFWEGADFKLKIRQVEGYPNYDKSEFDIPKPLFDDDDKLVEIWEKEYSLTELTDPKHFKSYEDLEARLSKVLALNSAPSKKERKVEEIPTEREPVMKEAKEPEYNNITYDDDDDDDALSLFKSLAEDDD